MSPVEKVFWRIFERAGPRWREAFLQGLNCASSCLREGNEEGSVHENSADYIEGLTESFENLHDDCKNYDRPTKDKKHA